MKKILIVIVSLFFGNFIFSENYLKEYISEFLNKGNYLLVEDNTDSVFYPKHILARLECDSDDLKMIYIDAEDDYETKSFNIKKYLIRLDDNNNIVIKKSN